MVLGVLSRSKVIYNSYFPNFVIARLNGLLMISFQHHTFVVIDANPFLQKVQKQLSSRLQRMPEMYSVTSVLNAWVSYGYDL